MPPIAADRPLDDSGTRLSTAIPTTSPKDSRSARPKSKANHLDEALATIAGWRNSRIVRAIFLSQGPAWVKKQEWEQAWDALQQYG